jgi:3-deoxy-7-phosphoheptulonate synthase
MIKPSQNVLVIFHFLNNPLLPLPMLIVLQKKHDKETLAHVQDLLKRKYECDSHVIGENARVIAVPGDTTHVDINLFKNLDGVKSVDRVDRPYKLADRKQKDKTEITIRTPSGRECHIGSRSECVVIAGPCTVESEEQLDAAASMAKEAGCMILRGGAFKPRTGPYSFDGLGEEALKMLKAAGEKHDMATISEAMKEEQVDLVSKYADIIQIGARNMQNYDLLRRVGTCKKPVLLKRGLAATLDEWLLAAEYILAGGNKNVILCERGIRTHEKEVRFTLCLGSIPALRELTHLPIIVDPSHAMGTSRWVKDAACAGVAVGADGLIIEVDADPEAAKCDSTQLLDQQLWTECMDAVSKIASSMDKKTM